MCVSGVIDPGFLTGNIGGFAQAADDTRAVIDFMHNWPVPGDFPTPVPCTASGVTTYDVSISDVSGLQVPVNMVAGTDREFTLTVANAGPDAATGAVLLTARDANGNSIPTFPRTYNFTLASGTPTSWTEGLCVSYPTTITWTATVTAAFDVIPSNNSVTETTVVTGTAAVCGVKLDVADVVGLTEAAALAALDPQLVPNVTYASSNMVAAGVVISQVPAACVACATAGDTVDLVVSTGPAAALNVTAEWVRLLSPFSTNRSTVIIYNVVNNDTVPVTGTATLIGSDGSSFAASFNNLAPGATQRVTYRWTSPATPQTVDFTVTVTVNGVVTDTLPGSVVVQ